MSTNKTTRAMREANEAFKTVERKTTTDYAKEQKSIHDNRERLKAERLARDGKTGSRPGPRSGSRPG